MCVCMCVCGAVCVCESFVLASFSMLFWFVWQQLGRDSGLPYGSRMIKLLPKIRCLSGCPFRSLSLSLSITLSMLDFRLSLYSLYMTGLPALILMPLAG